MTMRTGARIWTVLASKLGEGGLTIYFSNRAKHEGRDCGIRSRATREHPGRSGTGSCRFWRSRSWWEDCTVSSRRTLQPQECGFA